jgi:hypothetical protein
MSTMRSVLIALSLTAAVVNTGSAALAKSVDQHQEAASLSGQDRTAQPPRLELRPMGTDTQTVLNEWGEFSAYQRVLLREPVTGQRPRLSAITRY